MTGYSRLATSLLCAASTFALVPAAMAQDANGAATQVEAVVVTGSRVISDASNSPTPLTEVSVAQLQATTPSDIPDALNKLPVFQGSSGPSSGAGQNGGRNDAGNVLNLRNFGGQRTLVLLDGHRVTPANADGTVDTDTLPQMLMQRVDVVTGGASAVYGSDAVTGVVNFVLDTKFDGWKVAASSGVSNYGDGANQQLGLAGGTDLFGGRGHIEGALRYYHQDLVLTANRPYGSLFASEVGSGSAASPFQIVTNARTNNRAFGGLIACAAATCPANGMQFGVDTGTITAFNKGTVTSTSTTSIGGDGTDFLNGAAIGGLRSYESFGRFSYNLDNNITFYVQARGAESHDINHWIDNALLPSATAPGTFFTNNPYLSTAQKAAFGTASTFTLTEVLRSPQYGDSIRLSGTNRNLNMTTGLDGTLFDRFDWDLYYTHGENRLSQVTFNNTNNQAIYAASDAVVNASGQTVCNVQTTTSAANYSGCVPINPFGVRITQAAYNYITGTTYYDLTNKLDNVGGSVSGTIVDLPAGPLKAAVSGEARWLSYQVASSASPTQPVDCTNLRNCSSSAPVWVGSVLANVLASENVWEFAGETDIPVVKDLPLVQAFNINAAGRYTDYSTSGAAQTWKIGLDWHVNDDIRFRGTNSVDIRAPTLNDLYLPLSSNQSGYTDILTTVGGVTRFVTQGNPNLVPEVARTYTGGVVLTPDFIPGLTTSLDYYRIVLKNAITQLAGSSTQVQNLCIASGGTSVYCSLYVRPFPISNTTAANYPTEVLTENLNASFQRLEGLDFETDYNFNLGDIWEGADGAVTFRGLMNYQPMNETQQFAGAALTTTVGLSGQPVSKTHVTLFAEYEVNDWQFALQDHWYSGFNPSLQPGVQIWSSPSRIPSFNTVDVNIDRTFDLAGGTFDGYLNVQNIANANAPIFTNTSGSIGEFYPTPKEEDRMGRYFTIGIRAKF